MSEKNIANIGIVKTGENYKEDLEKLLRLIGGLKNISVMMTG